MSRRIGLIARADDGGLGTLTWEFWRHVQPAATLVVNLLEKGRSLAHADRYADGPGEVQWSPYPIPAPELAWLLDRCDVVYTAEVTYSRFLLPMAEAAGVEVIVHVMPELYQADELTGATLWCPTDWRVPGHATVVPVPVALDRFDVVDAEGRSVRDGMLGALHVAGAAMLDRNGTDLLARSLPRTRIPQRVYVRGDDRLDGVRQVGACEVIPHRRTLDPYWTLYRHGGWLVQPRRYGGLSLVAQEAAAAAMPLVCLDREPERSWPHTVTIPVTGSTSYQMKGGRVPVYDADSYVVAATLDNLQHLDYADLSLAALTWAESLSWGALLPRYRELLG